MNLTDTQCIGLIVLACMILYVALGVYCHNRHFVVILPLDPSCLFVIPERTI